MGQTFTPHKPERYVVVKITTQEADLIQKLRKYAFGQFTVHKMNNKLVRVEIVDSQMISEDNEINLD